MSTIDDAWESDPGDLISEVRQLIEEYDIARYCRIKDWFRLIALTDNDTPYKIRNDDE